MSDYLTYREAMNHYASCQHTYPEKLEHLRNQEMVRSSGRCGSHAHERGQGGSCCPQCRCGCCNPYSQVCPVVGPTGPTGPTGLTGPTGPTGPAGSGTSAGRIRAIQVELTNAPDGDIVSNAPTLFNSVLNNTLLDVTYTPANGQFLIQTPGDYYASWWVVTDGTSLNTSINFSLERNNVPIATATTPIVTGQLNGMAHFTVDTAPVIVTLVNTSNDIVQFANTSVQGSMVIIKVSE